MAAADELGLENIVLDACVWSFEFYVNTNPDLYEHGIATLEQVRLSAMPITKVQ